MGAIEKKKLEYIQVRSFLELYDSKMASTMTFDPRQERPDILIGSIGIEVTEYLDSDLKKYVEIKKKINHKIKEELKASGAAGIFVSLHYPNQIKLSKSQATGLGKEIAQFICRNSARTMDQFSDFQVGGFEFPFLQYMKKADSEKIEVVSPSAAWESSIDVSKMNKKVEEKGLKALSYDSRCTELWLLVVVDGYDEASINHIGSISRNDLRETSYKKVFLFDRFRKNYNVLKD